MLLVVLVVSDVRQDVCGSVAASSSGLHLSFCQLWIEGNNEALWSVIWNLHHHATTRVTLNRI